MKRDVPLCIVERYEKGGSTVHAVQVTADMWCVQTSVCILSVPGTHYIFGNSKPVREKMDMTFKRRREHFKFQYGKERGGVLLHEKKRR